MTFENSFNQNSINSYFQNGFLRVSQIIPEKLLQKLRTLFVELMANTVEKDIISQVKNGKRYVSGIDRLSNKGNLTGLELLGFPPLLEIAEKICGEDFFSVQEFAVIKEAGDDLPVLWHQDMLHQRGGNGLTMGIYLDDADENDGALRVVPQSHLLKEDICRLSRMPFIQVPMKAGDVLLHDMLLAHSSEPLRKNQIRRVIYFEFLSMKHVLQENIYPLEGVNLRLELLKNAVAFYRQQNPAEKTFLGTNKRFQALEESSNIEAEVEKIYQTPFFAKPSAYCLEFL